jgi:hypothetical protein
LVVILWLLVLQLPVQSVPITTKVVSSNPVHDEVYSIQHYVIKFVSGLGQVNGSVHNYVPIVGVYTCLSHIRMARLVEIFLIIKPHQVVWFGLIYGV